MSPRRRMALCGALVLVLGACGGEVVDFGSVPGDDAPSLPADVGLDARDAAAGSPPPTDARLATGGWPEAAAFIAREAERGRPTLVNIFASWCGPCRAEMPLLLATHDDRPDVAFLGIDHLDRREDGEAFIDEFGIDFATIHDLDGDVAVAVGSRGMPTTVVFDAEARLVGRVVGELTPRTLADLLDQVS